MPFRYQRLPLSPHMDLTEAQPSGSPPTATPHYGKPLKAFGLQGPHSQSPWHQWTWRLRHARKRYWAMFAAFLTAGIVAAIVAGVLEWKKHDGHHLTVADLDTDIILWFNNDLHGGRPRSGIRDYADNPQALIRKAKTALSFSMATCRRPTLNAIATSWESPCLIPAP